MMEQWNTGILGLFRLGMPWLPRRGGYPWYLYQHSWRNYKNWSQCAGGAQEALIQTLKLCVFDHYFYPVKPFFSVSPGPWFQHSIIPCRRHKTSVVKSCMISIYYRNSETLNYICQKTVTRYQLPPYSWQTLSFRLLFSHKSSFTYPFKKIRFQIRFVLCFGISHLWVLGAKRLRRGQRSLDCIPSSCRLVKMTGPKHNRRWLWICSGCINSQRSAGLILRIR